MGQVESVILEKTVVEPMQNRRMTIELCENVHLHYRNLRLEFSQEEFRQFVAAIKTIDSDTVRYFQFSPEKFQCLFVTHMLPTTTEWNDRLRIEKQVEGHYHIHYRNLRIEVKSLEELGYEPKS